MLLLIKGTPNVAKDAAHQRRIQISTFKYDPRYRTTYAYSHYGDQNLVEGEDITLTEWQTRIMEWFGEIAEVTPGIGYPDGTLLHYVW